VTESKSAARLSAESLARSLRWAVVVPVRGACVRAARARVSALTRRWRPHAHHTRSSLRVPRLHSRGSLRLPGIKRVAGKARQDVWLPSASLTCVLPCEREMRAAGAPGGPHAAEDRLGRGGQTIARRESARGAEPIRKGNKTAWKTPHASRISPPVSGGRALCHLTPMLSVLL